MVQHDVRLSLKKFIQKLKTNLFISRYRRSTTNIIIVTYNRSFLSICLTLSLAIVLSVNRILFSVSVSDLPVPAPTTSSHSVISPLLSSITPSLFHSRLKTYLFHKSFLPLTLSGLRTDSTDFMTGLFFVCASPFLFSVFIQLLVLFIGSVRHVKLAIRYANK